MNYTNFLNNYEIDEDNWITNFAFISINRCIVQLSSLYQPFAIACELKIFLTICIVMSIKTMETKN